MKFRTIMILLVALATGLAVAQEKPAMKPIVLRPVPVKKLDPVILHFVSLPLLVDGKRHRVAIADLEDRTMTVSGDILSAAREYLRGEILSTDKVSVILKDPAEKAAVKKEKKETWKEDVDPARRIAPGSADAADTLLASSISSFGGVYIFSLELLDLKKETVLAGSKAEYDGSEAGLRLAIKEATGALMKKTIK